MDLEFTFKAGQPNGSSFRLVLGGEAIALAYLVIEYLTRLT